MIGSRASSEINSSSIFESRNSTALFTDSLEPLAANDAEDQLEDQTMKIANQIAEKSPFAIERAKKSVKLVANNTMKKGLKIEQELFVECFKSNDGKEGIKAFIEKRKPEFQGN